MVTNINKTNSHLSSQLIESTAYGIENPGHGLGQAQKCVGVKPVNGIPNPPLDNWISIDYWNKRIILLLNFLFNKYCSPTYYFF
jgi:hypothetical protein